MFVAFKDQPELGVWFLPHTNREQWVTIEPTRWTPAGLAALAEHARIKVKRSALRRHQPTQTERLF